MYQKLILIIILQESNVANVTIYELIFSKLKAQFINSKIAILKQLELVNVFGRTFFS